MCGIVGVLSARAPGPLALDALLPQLRDTLVHRGPDDAGLWIDAEAGIALGHRRLAIVDLSAQGHQPMASASGRFQVVFNGEIYNHQSLRAALGTQHWRGHSDTETLLALFEQHGVRAGLQQLVGMFAIAVWDRQERTLTLARDRMGEKPLYWSRLADGSFVFGSELRALAAHPQLQREINRDALAQLLRYNCIPAPHTVYKGVHKLPPACWMELRPGAEPVQGRYWDLATLAARGQADPLAADPAAAVDELEALLARSIGEQMLADVPLGAFLSGGVDSSTVVALMAKASSQPVRSFCIGFDEGATSEAAHARAVASHLGTDHTELILSGADALAVVPALGRVYDEPFADSSQIPTYLVARMARQHVTVALSGDAGDELFAGYNRHGIAARQWPRLNRLPLVLRRSAAALLQAIPPSGWDGVAALLQAGRPASRRHADVGDKLHKLARQVLPAADARALYEALISHWPAAEDLVPGAHSIDSDWSRASAAADWSQPAQAMMLADQLGYLPEDILVKVDRAAMAVSLETRAPFLDHRVVEFAWRVPLSMKLRAGESKWLLRQVLYRHVPRELIERPKQGFAVPLDAWLRGPLRDWAEALLAPRRLQEEGFFDSTRIRAAWAEHLSGRANRQHQLWSILMFQAWKQEQR